MILKVKEVECVKIIEEVSERRNKEMMFYIHRAFIDCSMEREALAKSSQRVALVNLKPPPSTQQQHQPQYMRLKNLYILLLPAVFSLAFAHSFIYSDTQIQMNTVYTFQFTK